MPILPWEKSWKYFFATPWICNWWYLQYSEFPNHFHLVPTSCQSVQKKCELTSACHNQKTFALRHLQNTSSWTINEVSLLFFASNCWTPTPSLLILNLSKFTWHMSMSYLKCIWILLLDIRKCNTSIFCYIVYVFLVILLGIFLININPLVDFT